MERALTKFHIFFFATLDGARIILAPAAGHCSLRSLRRVLFEDRGFEDTRFEELSFPGYWESENMKSSVLGRGGTA